jgi:hypothetical protein
MATANNEIANSSKLTSVLNLISPYPSLNSLNSYSKSKGYFSFLEITL